MSEKSITHIWDRFNLRWIISGAAAGILAGFAVIFVVGFCATEHLGEWTQPLKLIAALCYGPTATAFGSNPEVVMNGALIHAFFCAFYGATFAQLVQEESSIGSLVALGLVTSFIIWVFGFQLFMPSVNRSMLLAVPTVPGLLIHLSFGVVFAFALRFTSSHVGR